MDFEVQFLSFNIIEGEDEDSKRYRHFQTLDAEEYEEHAIKEFLDGELAKIVKRKAERHPKSETVPTKIGRFIVEEGHALSSNPNYNLLYKLKNAQSKELFQKTGEELIRAYLDTSAVRSGAFLIVSAKPEKYFDDKFLFILKCDFEPKVVSITDESTLIRNVEMAITTKNMKSIQYPYMQEEGMADEAELKIHQASHARYFEDFLKFVEYGESMPQILRTRVKTMVEEHFHEVYEENTEERERFEKEMDVWEVSPQREIRERLSLPQVVEAAAQIVELAPETELKMKVGDTSVKGRLSDFGETIHLAKVNDKYVLLLEADAVTFEKGVSPIEFHKPEALHAVVESIMRRSRD